MSPHLHKWIYFFRIWICSGRQLWSLCGRKYVLDQRVISKLQKISLLMDTYRGASKNICLLSEKGLILKKKKNKNNESFSSWSVCSLFSFFGASGRLRFVTETLPLYSLRKLCLFNYTENFTTKKWKSLDKEFWYFFIFCSKLKLWGFVRTASMRRF